MIWHLSKSGSSLKTPGESLSIQPSEFSLFTTQSDRGHSCLLSFVRTKYSFGYGACLVYLSFASSSSRSSFKLFYIAKRVVILDEHLIRDLLFWCGRYAKFQGVASITLHFPENFGTDATRLHYIGFRGEATSVSFRSLSFWIRAMNCHWLLIISYLMILV